MSRPKLEDRIEAVLEELGYELVVLERGGGRSRPLLRLRIDRPGAGEPGASGVTVSDCERASRVVGDLLEEDPDAPADYILEVSSPGVERPLVRPRDFERFAGREVLVRGYGPIHEGARQVTGRLLGLGTDEEAVAVEVSGRRLEVPFAAIAKAQLVYDWEEDL